MAKKAKKTASRVKPERTRSRAAVVEETNRQFQIDKLGKVYSWNVPPAPYAANGDHRAAFIGGFRTRVEQVNRDTTGAGVPLRFSEGSAIQRAFEDGYNEAARQDGLNLKPKGLTGSTTTPAPAARPARKTAGGGTWPNRPARAKK